MNPMGFGPYKRYENEKAMPSSLKEVPKYVKELVVGFLSRFFYIFGIVWKSGPWILFVLMFTAVFEGIMPVISSLISKDILNQLQTDYSVATGGETLGEFFVSSAFYLLIFLFIYRILSRVVSRMSASVTRVAGEKVVRYVRLEIMKKAKTIDIACFDIPEFYEKLENANREAGNRPIAIIQSTFSAISHIIGLISYIAILASAPGMWWTAVVIAIVSVPSAIINFVYRRKNFNYMRRRSKDRRQMNYYSDLLVNKDMVKEIRMFDLSDTFIGRFDSVFKQYYSGMRKLIISESIWLISIAVISSVANCICYAMVALGVFRGVFQIGDYSLYTGALTSIANNVATLISVSATIYEGTLFIDNLISFMKVKPTVIPRTETPERVEHGAAHTIKFENVSFKYPNTQRYVIKNVNLEFRPGETVVLVGLNGAGKTTLIKLLTRLYDPTEGRILLDGKDLRDYDVKDLYSIFGIIFQDFGKYAVKVNENIHFGDVSKKMDAAEIENSAVQSNAHDFIQKLPDGYETPLMRIFEENGIELSIGQWQKLAVARAFYSSSDVLILDEPTASLDPIAEQEIFNQFDMLRKDKMTVFVSHRLSSATVASKIVVLEYGEVIEEGTHSELMAKQGRYYDLFSTQANRYIEETDSVKRNDRGVPPMKRKRRMDMPETFGNFPIDF